MSEMDTIVDRMYQEHNAVVQYLLASEELSFSITADTSFRKALVIAAASYFETQVIMIINDFVIETSSGNQALSSFVSNKALHRQYHALFDWNANNANSFYGLFGEPYKKYMQGRIKVEVQLDSGVKAFISLGDRRNKLAHGNFSLFELDLTAEEIYAEYISAKRFVDELASSLRLT